MALLLSPVAILVGGAAVTLDSKLFVVGGLLFWPGYFLLAKWWLQRGVIWALPLMFLWCGQGCFQLVHRYWMIMSA
ncbi:MULTISPECIES: hypothetical protein [unclassified Corallococcus]|uniref:hypothetical protein n=1 Tax=unclassified Corallococcus TaxID=2685029 RepID=UPI001CBEEFAD|nr:MULTISPECIES: hypothetical protein [unclassified Corallococcus]MBZ4331553.1 hypothetical protein [Corallococcus sp. AS-1-12]